MKRIAFLAATVLALAASAKPPQGIPDGDGWFCPSQKVRGMPLQCQRDAEECKKLVETANLNTGKPDPSCVSIARTFCHSFRARVGDGEYGRPEAYCFVKKADCERASKEARSFGARYSDHSECAPSK
jgi:hypothetical protein